MVIINATNQSQPFSQSPISILHLADIPEELVLLIFTHLPQSPHTLILMSSVQKSWYLIFSRDIFWKLHVKHIYPQCMDIVTKNFKNVYLGIIQTMEMKKKTVLQIQVVVTGESGSGKSALIKRWATNSFGTHITYIERKIEVDRQKCLLIVREVYFEEEVILMDNSQIQNGTAFLICYDLSCMDSVKSLKPL